MDTTSHDFTWTVETLGEGNSSDVTIVNDTLVYAVGGFYLRDSTGQSDPTAYCLAIWKGSSWEIRRLYYNGSNLIADVRGVHAFGANNVWLSAGSVFHWGGVGAQAQLDFSRLTLSDPNATVEKILGCSGVHLYGVGNAGTIIVFDGTSWHGLTSGTTVDLRDIGGSLDGASVWACGYSNSYASSILIALSGQTWNTVWARQGGPTPPYGDLAMSVWVYGGTLYTATNIAVFKQPSGSAIASARQMLTLDAAPYRIRGSGHNNIVVVGDQAKIWHYNGSTWKLLTPGHSSRVLYSVAVSANLIIAVGSDYSQIPSKAIVYSGRRQ